MSDDTSGMAMGFSAFAGLMMILIGLLDIVAGFAGIIHNDFYAVSSNYVFHFNASTWGWVNLLFGLVILLAGVGVFGGAVWARTVGVIIAVVAAVESFMFIPVYPLWGITLVTISVFVIWALTVHGRDLSTR